MGGSEGLRHRGSSAAAAAPEPPVQEDPSVTPEQRKLVQQILVAKSYYEVMGVSRDASDVDIKSAYKKVRRFVNAAVLMHGVSAFCFVRSWCTCGFSAAGSTNSDGCACT